ncbi:MAG TPA: hypothetical protein VNJ03_17555 [Vicinamibacterales bacterium]|nr:hypothetical protein [Vicinamibacterales bacterium]
MSTILIIDDDPPCSTPAPPEALASAAPEDAFPLVSVPRLAQSTVPWLANAHCSTPTTCL